MITNRKILNLYLDADKFALGVHRTIPIPFVDAIWIYERTLRMYEFHKNVDNRLRKYWYSLLLEIRGQRLGFSISGNCFGPGLRINHHGLLIVNAMAKIGKWCDIHQGVNIGENGYIDENDCIINEVPTIGDYCFIGPGAKIFGKCRCGNNVRVGANAIVNKDVQDNQTVYGVPQKNTTNKKNIITIADKNTEELFLKKYPQYRDVMETI